MIRRWREWIGRARAFVARRIGRPSGAGAYWDQHLRRPRVVYWAEPRLVRESVNRWVTGVSGYWPTEALSREWLPGPQGRGVSIGCGTGNLERNLIALGVCREIDAFDVSADSIREAERLAAEAGIAGVRYRVADCDLLELARGGYDIALFHHSLHHIADPDRLLDQVRAGLRPGGYLYVDEYVGPSRDEWTEEHLRRAREAYDRIEPALRQMLLGPPIDYTDPSEMIRSSRILPAIAERFEILIDRPYWGNLLFPLLSALDGHALLAPERDPLLAELVARERALVESGDFPAPLFAVLLARKPA